MAPSAHIAGSDWSTLISLDLALLVAVAYAVRVGSLRGRGRRVPGRARQACFYIGIAVLLAALFSPIDEAGERVFYLHMVQHLLIGDVSALLIVAGLDGAVLRPVLSKLHRLRPLAHPLVALPLWAVVLYTWHLPVLYEATLRSPPLHAFEHLSFLAAGMLMWGAVLEPLPGPAWFGAGAKAAYVLVVRTLGAVLGSIFIWAGEPLYPAYAAGERGWGISPLTDQAIGGGIMFVEGAVITLAVFAWLFVRWTREAEARQSLLDAGAEERVANRAARYGRRGAVRPAPPPSP